MRKLLRIVAVRKWYVIAAALVGASIGYLTTSGMNDARQPQFEATAGIVIESPESGRDREANEGALAEALTAAEAANQDVIEEGVGRVIPNPQTGELVFSARAREESLAFERAEAMRSAYLETTAQGTAEDREEQLREIVAEAAEVSAQLEQLDPSIGEEPVPLDTELDPEVAAQLDVLDALVNRLTQQHTKLEVDLILAEAGNERVGEPEDIQAELDAVTERLDEIYAEIAQISAENDLTAEQVTGRQTGRQETSEPAADPRETDLPSGAQTPGEVERQWTIAALESRYEELAAEYEALFVQDEAASQLALATAQVADLTPPRVSVRLNIALGLLLGSVVAVALAVGEAKLSGRIYVLSDAAPLNRLAEIPAARGLLAGRPGLRVAAASPRRVDGVHRLRIAVLGMMGSHRRSPVIGVTRVGLDHLEAGMLVTDLARRLAASGRSILVLDVDFGDDSPYSVPASSKSVADLISMAKADPEAAATQMKRAFAEVTSTESFRLIRSGELEDDPADVVLTAAFKLLLDVAGEQSDIVLIVTQEAARHSTFSLQQGLDGVIAITGTGSTRRVKLLEMAQPGSTAVPLGVVLLTGWRRRRARNLVRAGGLMTKTLRFLRDRLKWRRASRNTPAESGGH